MDKQKQTATQTPKPRTSKLAIASFIIGMLFLQNCTLWPILALPAIICGIVALCKIHNSKGTLKGKYFAIVGFMPLFIIVVVFIHEKIWRPQTIRIGQMGGRVVCSTYLKGLGNALAIYADEHKDLLPPADQWCDLLIQECDLHPTSFRCPQSDAIDGESTYAISRNAAGRNINELPPDIVLLFETNAGRNNDTRSEPISNRRFYSFFEKTSPEWLAKNKNHKIYPNCWNLSGGPEMLSTRYHKGEGCNILFADGHSEYIPSDEIHTLRWTVEESSK